MDFIVPANHRIDLKASVTIDKYAEHTGEKEILEYRGDSRACH